MYASFTDTEQGSSSNILLYHISNECNVHIKAIGNTALKGTYTALKTKKSEMS